MMGFAEIIGLTFGMLTIIFTNIGMFLWLRAEANDDRREGHALIKAIHDEMKDFHGRLCKLEERYLQLREERK